MEQNYDILDLSSTGMDAVILAAGRGSRLGPETDTRPKCLTKLGGRSLLQIQLELLAEIGVSRICVVAGYQAKAVQEAVGSHTDVIYNDLWDATNSMYSMWLCRRWVERPVIVMNCDVVVGVDAIGRLHSVPGSAFLYDSLSGDDQEHMKVELNDGNLTAMSKDLPAERVFGENVGVLKFDREAVQILTQEAGAALKTCGPKHWLAGAVERLCEIVPMRGVDISDLPWVEIDYREDLDLARREVWPAIKTRAGDEANRHCVVYDMARTRGKGHE